MVKATEGTAAIPAATGAMAECEEKSNNEYEDDNDDGDNEDGDESD